MQVQGGRFSTVDKILIQREKRPDLCINLCINTEENKYNHSFTVATGQRSNKSRAVTVLTCAIDTFHFHFPEKKLSAFVAL